MRIFLFIAALAIATLNISNVKGMELVPSTSAHETTPGVASKKFFKTFALLQLQDRYFLPKDIYTHILHDLFFVYVLPEEFSAYLKQNTNNPNEVVKLIGQLFKDHGRGVSASLLRMAFADALMWIGAFQSWYGKTCLHNLCNKKKKMRGVHDLDCITIILSVAPLSTWDLISKLDSSGWSAWHMAIYNGHDDIVDLFINWANANNMIRELLTTKKKAQTIALHIAAFNGRAGILKTLLAQADKHNMVEELLDTMDEGGDTVLDDAERYGDFQARKKMIEIIEFYRAKSKLTRMSLESNDL